MRTPAPSAVLRSSGKQWQCSGGNRAFNQGSAHLCELATSLHLHQIPFTGSPTQPKNLSR